MAVPIHRLSPELCKMKKASWAQEQAGSMGAYIPFCALLWVCCDVRSACLDFPTPTTGTWNSKPNKPSSPQLLSVLTLTTVTKQTRTGDNLTPPPSPPARNRVNKGGPAGDLSRGPQGLWTCCTCWVTEEGRTELAAQLRCRSLTTSCNSSSSVYPFIYLHPA